MSKLAPWTTLGGSYCFIKTPKADLALTYVVQDSTEPAELPILKVTLCDGNNVVPRLVNQWVVVPSLVYLRS